MSFLQEIKKGYFCIVQKVKVGSEWKKEIIRKATEEEIKTNQTGKQIKDMTFMTCTNPECDKQIAMPRSQKRKFFKTYFLRYGRIDLPYCSQACQQAHSNALRKLN